MKLYPSLLLCCLLGCRASPVVSERTAQSVAALSSAPTSAPAIAMSEDERLLALGHEKFIEGGCVKCHDERGDKPLEDGRRLSEMEFTEPELAEKVGHRAHDFAPEEQRAILRYVKSILVRPLAAASVQ